MHLIRAYLCEPSRRGQIKSLGISSLHNLRKLKYIHVYIHVHVTSYLHMIELESRSVSVSLLQYFAKVNVLPTTEETEIREKSTAKAKKVWQRYSTGSGKNNPAVNTRHAQSDEARAKFGKYASINRILRSIANSHELNHKNFPGIIFY